jgi:hypothetical protein
MLFVLVEAMTPLTPLLAMTPSSKVLEPQS